MKTILDLMRALEKDIKAYDAKVNPDCKWPEQCACRECVRRKREEKQRELKESPERLARAELAADQFIRDICK